MKQYLQIEPWTITENGFQANQSAVSESIFSLANEYMGIRGHFDEGYGGESLIGSYFNGVYSEQAHVYPLLGKGFPERNHFMVNAVNWLYTRVLVDGEQLDLNESKVTKFVRRLDLKTGTLTREFVWKTRKGRLRVRFTRFLSMVQTRLGCQRIALEPMDFSGNVDLTLGLDFSPPHQGAGRSLWEGRKKESKSGFYAILAEAEGSGQKIQSTFRYTSTVKPVSTRDLADAAGNSKLVGTRLRFRLSAGLPVVIDRLVANHIERDRKISASQVWRAGRHEAKSLLGTNFDRELAKQSQHWAGIWKRFDIAIEGDPANEQGTRYCLFQMLSTYHGTDPRLNIGAKGLTGEAYGGLAFWDTETYCLPFYIFTDPAAARSLLGFRYNTLEQAKERARQLDCEGARYPMTTIDGTETCGVWYHGDLEIHVPAAVAYGVWHYVHVTGDCDFMHRYGLEMLIEISRFYASHGDWNPKTGEFGLWGVMGPDEFHMMVHNNAYTNAMAKKTFEWTLKALKEMERSDAKAVKKLCQKVGLGDSEPLNWRKMAGKMRLQRDAKTGMIEQHDGFFELPHIDLDAIPAEKLPIVKKYAYIKRSRHDWIKQPDVLLLPFFFSHEYSRKEKEANFDYYEPRCVHESSLSPGVHSILATELGRHEMAFDYVKYASRLDLDDYNGNTNQGLHMTSMAAAWMSLVYGFGGMRSDGARLSFQPSIPGQWQSFSFRIVYRKALLEIHVAKKTVSFRVLEGPAVAIDVYGKKHKVGSTPLSLPIPAANRG